MLDIKKLNDTDKDFDEKFKELCSINAQNDPELTETVSRIIEDLRKRGDAALLEYTNRFDDRHVSSAEDLEISKDECNAKCDDIPGDLLEALRYAADRISSYASKQKAESWSYQDKNGTLLGQQVTPLERAGVYVPGGRAAYPSSVLMNTIPAKVAGVDEVIMVVPAPRGELNPVVLAAADIAGVDRIFSIGGAQAVAALAYGTESVPPVDKIVGPGNRYVAEAKRQVFGQVGIDMIAGPSEVLIIADDSCDPDWIAMDLFAQAEHDADARSILVSTSHDVLEQIFDSVIKLLPEMERREIIRESLQRHGAIIHARDLDSVADIINRIAPEHLELAIQDPEKMLPRVRNAGAIFLGGYTSESLGDYCAGPNHVLPTARSARFSSPLGVYDFQKRTSVIKCVPDSASQLAQMAAKLARGEGLTAHARSAEYRIGYKSE